MTNVFQNLWRHARSAIRNHGLLGTARLVVRGTIQSERIRRVARRSTIPPTGKRILVVRGAGIGDVVCTFPAVRALREKYPSSYIAYGTHAANVPIVEMANIADDVFALEWWNPVRLLARTRFDHVFFPSYVDSTISGKTLHIAEQFANQLDVKLLTKQPIIEVSIDQKAVVSRLVNEFSFDGDGPKIAFHTGPTWVVREWPVSHWKSLGELLHSKLRARILHLGTSFHTDRGNTEVPQIPHAQSLVGKLSLVETAEVISCCDLFIGIDSGLLHIAGAVGTPSLAIFGSVIPSTRLPPTTPSIVACADLPCLGCQHEIPCGHWVSGCKNDIACMREVTPEQVTSLAINLLAKCASSIPLKP